MKSLRLLFSTALGVMLFLTSPRGNCFGFYPNEKAGQEQNVPRPADHLLLDTVIADIAAMKQEIFMMSKSRKQTQIVIFLHAISSDENILLSEILKDTEYQEHWREEWEAGKDLLRRRGKKEKLAPYKTSLRNILVQDKEAEKGSFSQHYPSAKAAVYFGLPGYSSDSRTAILRCHIRGANMAGATVQYVLNKEAEKWKVTRRTMHPYSVL